MASNNTDSAPYWKNVDISKHYEIGDQIGRGAFSVVKKGKQIKDGKFYAIKCINKKMVRLASLEREIAIMQKIRHPHCLSMIEVFEDDKNVNIVLDLVTGGELFEKVVERGHFSEKDAAALVKQIVEAVAYLHSQGIAHRDLKPENLLCSDKEPSIHIFVSDFGLSRLLDEASFQQMSTQCGSLEYCAPEVLSGELYEKSVDLWSIGVITYILLTGFFPFYDPNRDPAVLVDKISNVAYDWEGCPETSSTAKDFVAKLLVFDPKSRYTAQQALEHPWLKGTGLKEEHMNHTLTNMLSKIVGKKKK